jgi:hypothetical protein
MTDRRSMMTDTWGCSDRGEQRQPDVVVLHEQHADARTDANGLRCAPYEIGREPHPLAVVEAEIAMT